MAEYDNAGFPLSYCLLSTTGSTEKGKRTKALENWTIQVRNRYDVNPSWVHVDKDMAEIGMVLRVWPGAKVSICWWHERKAVRERLNKAKLSTTPYDADRAHAQFSFIDKTFVPPGRADPNEREGGREGGGRDSTIDEPDDLKSEPDPNAIFIRLPATQAPAPMPTPPAQESSEEAPLKIKLPARAFINVSDTADSAESPKRTFCPFELREAIISKMQAHRNAHPLIPGDAAPTARGIYTWAVKKMYKFCEEYDLRELWAYLWENWYRPERWELWARSVVPEIPRLKTTMICESQSVIFTYSMAQYSRSLLQLAANQA